MQALYFAPMGCVLVRLAFTGTQRAHTQIYTQNKLHGIEKNEMRYENCHECNDKTR